MTTSTSTAGRTDAAAYLANVRAIVAELEGQWTTTDPDANPYHVTATRADGLKLAFYLEGGHWNDTARAEVSYTHPRYFEVRHYDDQAPRVNVTTTRKPATVAADLERRLIPDAETMHAHILQRIADVDAYHTSKATNLERMTAAAGATAWGTDDDGFRLRAAGIAFGDVKAGREDVAISLHGVTPELAAAILELVATHQTAN